MAFECDCCSRCLVNDVKNERKDTLINIIANADTNANILQVEKIQPFYWHFMVKHLCYRLKLTHNRQKSKKKESREHIKSHRFSSGICSFVCFSLTSKYKQPMVFVSDADVVLQHKWKQNKRQNTACTLWNIVYAVALSVLKFVFWCSPESKMYAKWIVEKVKYECTTRSPLKRLAFIAFAFVLQQSTANLRQRCILLTNEQVYMQACNVTSIACWLPFKRLSGSVFVSNLCRFVYFSYRNVFACMLFSLHSAIVALCLRLNAMHIVCISYARCVSLIWFPFSHTCGRRAKKTAAATTTRATTNEQKKTKNNQPKNDKQTNSSLRSLQAKSHDFYT